MVAVPFTPNLSSNLTPQTYELNLAKSTDPALSTLSSTTNELTNSTGIPLSAFNFLNERDYGKFYHVADPSNNVTYLLSYFVLANIGIPVTSLSNLSVPFPASTVDYSVTGDKLCFGSVSVGLVIVYFYQVSNPFEVKLPAVDRLVRNLLFLDVLHAR
jgi:hypothetical protein